jgi:glycogen phosphorylase
MAVRAYHTIIVSGRASIYLFLAVTPRRWLDQCNPDLSTLISNTLKIPRSKWLKELTLLEGLLKHVDDPKFRAQWGRVKQKNKACLYARFLLRETGLMK